jgi:hypothetical protein
VQRGKAKTRFGAIGISLYTIQTIDDNRLRQPQES